MDNYALSFIVLILLAIFIVFIIVISTGCGYDYNKETCKVYLSNLSGELMRADSGNSADRQYYKDVFNSYIDAAGCSSSYKLA